MNLDKLQQQSEYFKDALQKIKDKRELWQKETKPLLISTLETIKKSINLDWHVQILDWTKNSEGVNIILNTQPSGMVDIGANNSFKHYMKKGGGIVFSQAYNGDVFIIVMYPEVEELVSCIDNKLIGRFKPRHITQELILSKVEEFLSEMTNWERNSYGNKIGFQNTIENDS